MNRQKLSLILSHMTVSIVSIMLVSLPSGLLKKFFFDAEYRQVQGIDYFSAPKAFLNLLEHRSLYDSWQGVPYGPYATWYLAHPAFSVLVASWFSFFSPWVSYYLFALFSFALLVYAGHIIAKLTQDDLNQKLAYFFMLCGFPCYWLLFVGNIHAVLVLALTLIFVSLFEVTYADDALPSSRIIWKLLAGLLVSFLSKPIVLLMLPVLVLTPETRRTTLISLGVYITISTLFITVPLLNPQGIGMSKLITVAFDFDFIKQNMNIYANNFVLNEFMKDNSIHWLNLVAQSDFRLMHIDIFSLPVFVDTLVGEKLPSYLYKLPIYITMLLSVLVGFIPDNVRRLESILLLLMTISMTFFLSYNTVWEYQFTSIFPIVALLPILKEKNVFYAKSITAMLVVSAFIYLPSLYFMVDVQNTTPAILTLIRADRVLPVVLIFIIMLYCNVKNIVRVGALNNLPFKLGPLSADTNKSSH